MLLYRCPSFVTEASDGPCYRGDLADACHSVVAGWGTGGGVREGPPPKGFRRWFYYLECCLSPFQAFGFPDNMGIPIGGEGQDVFYRLEVHYNNPNNEAGLCRDYGLLRFKSEHAASLCVAANSGLDLGWCRQDR